MSIKIGSKTYKKIGHAINALKKTRPDVKDPKAYAAHVEKTIQERREAKSKKK